MNAIRLKLTIAYDGTAYQGWQVQKIGVGVQHLIEQAMASVFQLEIRLHGSSRTDTGVHARGMVAHFDLPAAKLRMQMPKVALALNSKLPPDIRVMNVVEVPDSFHARFTAKGKQYRYLVFNFHSHDPLLRNYAWHVPQPLDLKAIRDGTKCFLGKRDFAAFANNRRYEMESTVRTLHRCDVRKQGSLLRFVIEGDGFLYKMCRGIVGTLIQVGQGRFSSKDIPAMLEAKDRSLSGMTAPAHGLVLWKVFY